MLGIYLELFPYGSGLISGLLFDEKSDIWGLLISPYGSFENDSKVWFYGMRDFEERVSCFCLLWRVESKLPFCELRRFSKWEVCRVVVSPYGAWELRRGVGMISIKYYGFFSRSFIILPHFLCFTYIFCFGFMFLVTSLSVIFLVPPLIGDSF